jgi:4-methylaminobutanoate oxidase (formaldehyde-forming)
MLTLEESLPGKPLLLHEEPIYLKNEIVGKTTSGNYSFNYNKNLSFGYINSELTNEQLLDRDIYIEIEKKKYDAQLILKPLNQGNYKNI